MRKKTLRRRAACGKGAMGSLGAGSSLASLLDALELQVNRADEPAVVWSSEPAVRHAKSHDRLRRARARMRTGSGTTAGLTHGRPQIGSFRSALFRCPVCRHLNRQVALRVHGCRRALHPCRPRHSARRRFARGCACRTVVILRVCPVHAHLGLGAGLCSLRRLGRLGRGGAPASLRTLLRRSFRLFVPICSLSAAPRAAPGSAHASIRVVIFIIVHSQTHRILPMSVRIWLQLHLCSSLPADGGDSHAPAPGLPLPWQTKARTACTEVHELDTLKLAGHHPKGQGLTGALAEPAAGAVKRPLAAACLVCFEAPMQIYSTHPSRREHITTNIRQFAILHCLRFFLQADDPVSLQRASAGGRELESSPPGSV